MAFLQWRKFNFFEREVLKDSSTGKHFDKIKDLPITCCACGRGKLIFGVHVHCCVRGYMPGSSMQLRITLDWLYDVNYDREVMYSRGFLYLVESDKSVSSFKAYELQVSHLFQLKQHSLLVSVGVDEEGINHLVKVWNFDKTDKNGYPLCVRIHRAISGVNAVPVTCITVHENLNLIAIGFEDGSVSVVKGDVTRERNSKQRTIHQDKFPVTGLAFKQMGNCTILFVSTTETVASYNLSLKDRKELLDEFGCKYKCSALSDVLQENQFVVARTDAVYFYQPEGRGPCLVFEGEKKLVIWFRGYLVVVNSDVKQMPRAPGNTGPMNVLTVYDIKNKFIAYNAPFPEILDVLGEWGCLLVICTDGKIFQLEEKDTQTKLETLFKKNMYDMAINLAKSQHYSDGLFEIFRHYGDHLYGKGDHDGAIQQYIRTIGHLEASYVIRKFLDAQRIHNLTDYLQVLHEKGLANPDHTTLLLNCYTKLKAVGKLKIFMQTDKELKFDVETAIKVCRQAGYFKHALDLAEKYNQHEMYLKIQLEDVKDYKQALKYISMLAFEECDNNMKAYGKILVNEAPDEATELLKKLCTDYKPTPKISADGIPQATKEEHTDIHLDRQISDLAMSSLSLTMSHVYTPPAVVRARPDEFIHIFVHQRQKLKEFLEHMVTVRDDCTSVVYNTLIELYLNDATKASEKKDFATEAEQESKCFELMKSNKDKYDLSHAMVLAQMHNFKRGVLFLYDTTNSYQQLLQYHMQINDYKAVIDDCKKHGQKPGFQGLWSQALTYFARKEEDCKAHIVEVLDHIDKHNLLSPLIVVQTLAHNSNVTLSVIKEYIVRTLQREDKQIAKDEQLIRQYRDDTEKMRKQINELKSCAKIFQSLKCMICVKPLDLPAVHFLCGDSFHQHCFEAYSESDSECPICIPENRKVLDIIRSQENNKGLHEDFDLQLHRASDRFSVVADYFGKGVFNKVTVLTDPGTQQTIIQDSSHQRDSLLK